MICVYFTKEGNVFVIENLTEKLAIILLDNPWETLISLIIAIISVILGIYFGIKGFQRKIIKVFCEDIGITTPINHIETTFCFWNSSIPTISKFDLIPDEPFAISVIDGEILNASVIRGKNSSNHVKITYSNKELIITFDYLNAKEGGKLLITHTGKKFSISKKLIGGKIVDSNKLVNDGVIDNLIKLSILLFVVGFISLFTDFYNTLIPVLLFIDFCLFFFFVFFGIYYFILTKFVPKNCKEK